MAEDAPEPADPARDLVKAATLVAVLVGLLLIGFGKALAPPGCVRSDAMDSGLRCDRGACCEFLFMGVPLGVVVGALFAAAARALASRRLSEQPDSHTWIRIAMASAFALGLELSVVATAAVVRVVEP